MSAQVRQDGAAALLNLITSNVTFAASAPASPVGGQVYANTTSHEIFVYNSSLATWLQLGGTLYLALLIADPDTSSASGGPAANISDLSEDPTTGYARQSITFSEATEAVPAVSTNTTAITYGPYTANQSYPVAWAALVTASTGTTGLLLCTWELDNPQQVQASQNIVVPPNALELDQQ